MEKFEVNLNLCKTLFLALNTDASPASCPDHIVHMEVLPSILWVEFEGHFEKIPL
jgi:hypothetical protein